MCSRGPILVRTRPHGGGVHPPLYKPQNGCTEQWVLWAPGHTAGAYGRGKVFCSTLCVCAQNTRNFVEHSKMAEKHKKGS